MKLVDALLQSKTLKAEATGKGYTTGREIHYVAKNIGQGSKGYVYATGKYTDNDYTMFHGVIEIDRLNDFSEEWRPVQ